MKLAELFVDIVGRPQGLQAALASARSNLGTFAGAAGVAGAAGAGAFATVTAAANVAGAAIDAAFSAMEHAAKTAIEMESAMTGVEKAVDMSGKELADFQEALFKMSTELNGIKLDDLVKIATEAGKLGIAKKDVLEFTRGIAIASVALDDIPADEIANSLGKMNASFKLPVRELVNMASVMDKLADSGALTAKDLLNVTARLAGTTSAMKLTATETAALGAALLNTGTEAELAAGSIRDLLNKLATTEGQQAAAKILGKTYEEFAETIRTKPMKAIQELLKALSPLGLKEFNQAMKSIGVEAGDRTSEILKLAQSHEKLGEFAEEAARQIETGAQAQDSYTKRAKDAEAILINLRNHYQIMENALVKGLKPAFENVVAIMKDFTAALKDSKNDSVLKFINDLSAAVRDLGSAYTLTGAQLLPFVEMLEAMGRLPQGQAPDIRAAWERGQQQKALAEQAVGEDIVNRRAPGVGNPADVKQKKPPAPVSIFGEFSRQAPEGSIMAGFDEMFGGKEMDGPMAEVTTAMRKAYQATLDAEFKAWDEKWGWAFGREKLGPPTEDENRQLAEDIAHTQKAMESEAWQAKDKEKEKENLAISSIEEFGRMVAQASLNTKEDKMLDAAEEQVAQQKASNELLNDIARKLNFNTI